MATNIIEAPNGTQQKVGVRPAITGDRARRKANGYLGKYVGMFFGAQDPVLLPLDCLVWQVLVYFQMYDAGPFKVGFLDVDATTGEVIPLSDDTIDTLLNRADAFVKYNPPTAAPPF